MFELDQCAYFSELNFVFALFEKKMLNCPNLQLPIVFFKVALFTHTL